MTDSPFSPSFDFDALYRGESPAEGLPPVTTPPWDNKAPKENVISWQEAGLVHGDVPGHRVRTRRQRDLPRRSRAQGHRSRHLPDRADRRRATRTRRPGGRRVRGGRRDPASTATPTPSTPSSTAVVITAFKNRAAATMPWPCIAPPGPAPPCFSARSPTPTPNMASGRGRWSPSRRCVRPLGDAGWTITSLETITVPIDEQQNEAVMWMLQAQRA